MSKKIHQAGFVNIIGQPNVGKSTLINALVGEKLAIITPKAQTTRHRIIGIHNAEDFQVVYSDTPGFITPAYALHEWMVRTVNIALADADVLLLVIDVQQPTINELLLKKIEGSKVKVLLLLNKIDLLPNKEVLEALVKVWSNKLPNAQIIPISAKKKLHLMEVFHQILTHLPEHPPYYPKDTLTDKPERFFAAEIIREKILQYYQQEIPYSTEVVVTEFKQVEKILHISVEIYVERKSQKHIVIGKNGMALKKVGIAARQDLEHFFDQQVFLSQYVRVASDWRKHPQALHRFGYR